MATDPLKDERAKKELKRKILWVMLVSLYLGAFIGAERLYYESMGKDILSNIADVMQDAYTNRSICIPIIKISIEIPGALCIFPTDMGMVFVAGLIGAIYSLNEYTKYMSKKKTRTGEEYGSSSFNTNYEGLTKNFIMSPKILRQGFDEGKIEIGLSDYIKFVIRYRILRKTGTKNA